MLETQITQLYGSAHFSCRHSLGADSLYCSISDVADAIRIMVCMQLGGGLWHLFVQAETKADTPEPESIE
jgi:hypothetical protein